MHDSYSLYSLAILATLFLASCRSTDSDVDRLSFEGEGMMTASDGSFHGDESVLEGATPITVGEPDPVDPRARQIRYFAACRKNHSGSGIWKSRTTTSRKQANSMARSHNTACRQHGAMIYTAKRTD